MNLNEAKIIGRITQDLELKATPTGTSVCSFSVATNRVWKNDKGEKQESTQFHNVVAWGKQAETIAQYFMKGQEIYVSGRMETRNWLDKETQKKMYRTEIVVEQFEFGARPKDAGEKPTYAPPKGAKPINDETEGYGKQEEIQYPVEDINPEDIPF